MPGLGIYAGPGKMTYNGAVFWPQQENGLISYAINQSKLDFANAMFGRVGSQLGNTTGRITVTPYDNWAALPALYPAFIGATTLGVGGAAAGLAISTRPHNPPYGAGADTGSTIWNPDGLSIVVNRLALNRHPDLHLGVGKPLFGQAEFLVLPKTVAGAVVIPAAPGQTWVGSFHTINEAGQPEPGAAFITSDFVREAWTGVLNVFAGFGAVQAEDEWTISCNAKYDELKVQEQTMATKLASVEFMAKCRPFGPLWTQIETAIMTRGLGARWGNPGAQGAQINLTLTSQSGKTITLFNVDIQGENFEFGGARLATGEIGFVTQLIPGAVAPAFPSAFITFSA